MVFGDIRGTLDKMISLLKQISAHTSGGPCCVATTSAGVGTSVPAGFKSISIAKTSDNGTPVNITMSDGSIYALSSQFEVLVNSAPGAGVLPAYPIVSTSDTWKWQGIK